MDRYDEPVVDHLGRVMFYCRLCGAPIRSSDIISFGARLPEHGETAEDYLDAQLLEGIEHPRCVADAKAG